MAANLPLSNIGRSFPCLTWLVHENSISPLFLTLRRSLEIESYLQIVEIEIR